VRDLTLQIYARRPLRARARHHHRRHQVRVRPRRRRQLYLIDEALTPDSSRFWPADQWQPGIEPAELRQAVRARLPRDARLEQAGPGPAAAGGDHRRTAAKYREAYRRLTGDEDLFPA
jgi:phosphoribosylaminoimidazole-succinocarboxamide synthase